MLFVSAQTSAQESFNRCELNLNLNSVQQCDVHTLNDLENETISQLIYGPDGNLFLSGSPRSKGKGWDVMVTKLGPEGDLVWEARAAKNGTAIGSSVALSKTGKIAICGTQTTGDLSDPQQAFIALIDFDGNLVWEKIYFDSAFTGCESLTFVENEEIVIVGRESNGFSGGISVLTRISSTGEMLWSKKIEYLDEGIFGVVISDYENGVLVGGSEWNDQIDGLSPLLFHYSESGKLIKDYRFKGVDGERITHLGNTIKKGIVFGGSPWLDKKTIIGAISLNGKVRWKRSHPQIETQSVLNIEVLKDGTLAVLTEDFSNQIFNIVGFGDAGKIKWQASFKGCDETFFSEGAISADGDIVVLCKNQLIRASIKKTQ